MRLQLVILSAAALFTFTAAQTIDEVIKDVFPSEDTTGTASISTTVATQPASEGDGCSCVMYYLCNDTINTDGTGIIDIGIKADECESYFEVCCKDPIKVNPDKPITNKT